MVMKIYFIKLQICPSIYSCYEEGRVNSSISFYLIKYMCWESSFNFFAQYWQFQNFPMGEPLKYFFISQRAATYKNIHMLEDVAGKECSSVTVKLFSVVSISNCWTAIPVIFWGIVEIFCGSKFMLINSMISCGTPISVLWNPAWETLCL